MCISVSFCSVLPIRQTTNKLFFNNNQSNTSISKFPAVIEYIVQRIQTLNANYVHEDLSRPPTYDSVDFTKPTEKTTTEKIKITNQTTVGSIDHSGHFENNGTTLELLNLEIINVKNDSLQENAGIPTESLLVEYLDGTRENITKIIETSLSDLKVTENEEIVNIPTETNLVEYLDIENATETSNDSRSENQI